MKQSLIILTVIFLLSACQTDSNPPETTDTSPETITETSLIDAIEEANYCTVDSDCEVLVNKCPISCYALVNQAETEKIQGLIDDFKEFVDGSEDECSYDCARPRPVTCIENKCVMEDF